MDEALKKIIDGLALLVGFAWEQAFEGATHALASRTDSPVFMKVCFACAVCIMVVPAWRWYILAKVEEAKPDHQQNQKLRRMTKRPDQLGSLAKVGLCPACN